MVAVLASVGGLAGRAVAQNDAVLQPQGLSWAGVYALRDAEPQLTGAGVRMGLICRSFTYEQDEPQYDYRPNTAHGCFQNARLNFYDDGVVAPAVSSHETAVCSILFGDDPLGAASDMDPFIYQGAMPAADGHIYELQHFVAQHVFAQEAPPVDLLAASFGAPLEAWWTRGIESLAEHQGLAFVASIGNGSNASDPPLYPGAGPNVIGVGVVSSVSADDPATSLANFALAYPEQSSRGPTDDGRCKPDLIAPGNCLIAQAESNQDYTMSGTWSSFSAPVAAGVAGLLVQTAKQDVRFDAVLSPEGGNCLLKAILMTSATKLPYWHRGRLAPDDDHDTPLDYAQGAGMVNAVRGYQLLTAGRGRPGGVAEAGWDLNRLEGNRDLGQVYRLVVEEPADKVLTVTLAWNRHYSTDYPFRRIADSDSDLRLEVWAVDSRNPGNDVLLDYSDSRVDNVEHIYVQTPLGYTSYAIVVAVSDLDNRTGSLADERYAIAWDVQDRPADESILWHDLNADGIVNSRDLAILAADWGTVTSQ